MPAPAFPWFLDERGACGGAFTTGVAGISGRGAETPVCTGLCVASGADGAGVAVAGAGLTGAEGVALGLLGAPQRSPAAGSR